MGQFRFGPAAHISREVAASRPTLPEALRTRSSTRSSTRFSTPHSVLRTPPLSSHPLQRLDAEEAQARLHDGGGPGAEHETAGRYFSLSAQIRKERAQYYKELEAAQAGSLDATRWCVWFLGCLGRAADASNLVVERVLRRARFWSQAAAAQVNPRQRKALTRLLEGFVGDMTSGKYANLTRCSHDTAGRDLEALAKLGLLKANGKKGRRAGYQLP